MSKPHSVVTVRGILTGRQLLVPVPLRGPSVLLPHSDIARAWNRRVKQWRQQ